ncbi:hypothetical protein Avbf_18424, partial [Armadillidium vulgare]
GLYESTTKRYGERSPMRGGTKAAMQRAFPQAFRSFYFLRVPVGIPIGSLLSVSILVTSSVSILVTSSVSILY